MKYYIYIIIKSISIDNIYRYIYLSIYLYFNNIYMFFEVDV